MSLMAAAAYVMWLSPKPSTSRAGNPQQNIGADNHASKSPTPAQAAGYPAHTVTATKFWIGEAADASNAFIPNHESAWVGDWLGEFGGIDDPINRCGYAPCGFVPKQNTFYVALPFNDKGPEGNAKSADTLKKIPWYTGQTAKGVSLMKNRWVEITHGAKIAYGQIEDVGPMYEDDADYVFGEAAPSYTAGIDLSPALSDYLGTKGYATVQWRFVDSENVASGPWLDIITDTQINY